MVIYERHLLIFKMSNGSSYCEVYKRLLTPHVRSIPSKRKIFSFSHSLFLSFILLTLLFLISFFPLYVYIIKVIHSHLYFYLSYIYFHFTTFNFIFYYFKYIFTRNTLFLIIIYIYMIIFQNNYYKTIENIILTI